MPLFTVEVAVVGVAQIEVEADNSDDAREKAAECMSPLNIEEWSYVPDWSVLSEEMHLVHYA